jgi:hypothetical protein
MVLLRFLILMMLAAPAQAQEGLRLGVFGTVESVAPLVVAGQRITMPEGLKVISPLGTGHRVLRGDTLAVRAAVAGGELVAERVLEIYPVVGPVGRLAPGTARVMGTPVHIPPDVSLKSGDWVAVSGLWTGDTVITTRLRDVEPGSYAQLLGAVDPDSGQIGASALKGEATPKEGYGKDIWILAGTAAEDGLRVQLLSKGVFGTAVALALWQGYASLPVASQTYMIHGTAITGTARDAQMPDAGALILRCVHEGRVIGNAPEGLDAAFAALGCATHTPAE